MANDSVRIELECIADAIGDLGGEAEALGHALTEASLRDRIAMAALTGIIANPQFGWGGGERSISEDAKAAYFYADIMLRERAKAQGGSDGE